MTDFMKKPCKHCPYRSDVKPFLTPERGEELAYHAQNPYNSFPCHKTTEYSEDDEGNGEMMVVETSKMCAGFLTLQHHENGSTFYDSDGFEPSDNVYHDANDMIEAYADQD